MNKGWTYFACPTSHELLQCAKADYARMNRHMLLADAEPTKLNVSSSRVACDIYFHRIEILCAKEVDTWHLNNIPSLHQ